VVEATSVPQRLKLRSPVDIRRFHILFVDTIKYAEVTFDPRKDADNIENHGISLAKAEDFDFDAARYERDDSQDYGESGGT
jgi:hypothetical protein